MSLEHIGGKIDSAIRHARAAAAELIDRANAVEDAWTAGDIDTLVEMEIITELDAKQWERERMRAEAYAGDADF